MTGLRDLQADNPPSGETFYDFLARRERELENIAAALRGQLDTVENELAHVQSAKRQVGNIPAMAKSPAPANTAALQAYNQAAENFTNALAAAALSSDGATIKELIMRAFWARFQESGATPATLRQFIVDAYGRNVHPNSFSPQLSRLKSEGLLKNKEGEIWLLTLLGKKHMAGEAPQPSHK